MSFMTRIAARSFATTNAVAPKGYVRRQGQPGEQPEEERAQPIRRQVEEEEEQLQTLRRAQPDEQEAQPLRRQAEEEEEEMQALRREPADEEEAQQAQTLRRQPEEEEEELQTLRRAAADDEEETSAMPLRRQAEEEEEEMQALHREPGEEDEAQPLRRQAEEEEEELQTLRRSIQDEDEQQAQPLRRQAEEEEEEVAQPVRRMAGDPATLDAENSPFPEQMRDEPEPALSALRRDAITAPAAPIAPADNVPLPAFDPGMSSMDGLSSPPDEGFTRANVQIDQLDVLIEEPTAAAASGRAPDRSRSIRARYLRRI